MRFFLDISVLAQESPTPNPARTAVSISGLLNSFERIIGTDDETVLPKFAELKGHFSLGIESESAIELTI